jgi:Mg2+/Co2+ transporter CorC
MEESLLSIEILKNADSYIARIQIDSGDVKELRSSTFEGILEQVVLDIQDEYEVAL